MSLRYLFVLFLCYSFIGWLMEVIYTFILDRKLVNRGFLIGPYCPIYGCGCLLIIFLLKRYSHDPVALFIMSIVICSILEYFTSWIMEKIFKTRWWNYSKRKFNINGRICLETMIPFGVLGVFLIYILNPFVTGLLFLIPNNIMLIISSILCVIFLTDNIISYSVISNVRFSANRLKQDSTEEVTKIVRNYVYNYSTFGKRLIKSFPNIKINLRKTKKTKKKN